MVNVVVFIRWTYNRGGWGFTVLKQKGDDCISCCYCCFASILMAKVGINYKGLIK